MLLPQVVSCSKSLPWIAPPPHGIIVEEQIRSAKTMTYFQDVHRFISVYHRKVKVYMFNTFYQPNPIIKQIKVPSPWSHEGSVFVPDSYWSLRWRQDTILSEGLKPFGQQTISKVKLQHQFSSLRVAHNTNQDTTGVLLSPRRPWSASAPFTATSRKYREAPEMAMSAGSICWWGRRTPGKRKDP